MLVVPLVGFHSDVGPPRTTESGHSAKNGHHLHFAHYGSFISPELCRQIFAGFPQGVLSLRCSSVPDLFPTRAPVH